MSYTTQNKKSVFDISKTKADVMEDITTSHWEYRQFYDRQGESISAQTIKDFEINVNEFHNYIVPSQAYLDLEVSVNKKAGGAHFTNDQKVVCQYAGTFFSDAEYIVGDQVVESQRYSHMNAYIQQLLESSPDNENDASDTLFYPDTGAGLVDVNPATWTQDGAKDITSLEENPAYNRGFLKRWNAVNIRPATAAKKIFHVRIPLAHLFSFCKYNHMVFKGSPHQINLRRHADDRVVLFRAGAEDAQLEMTKMSLWLPIVKPNLTQMAVMEKSLSQDATWSLTYPLWTTYRSNQFTGESHRWVVSTLTEKPLKVFIFQQLATRYGGDQTTNKFIFDHNTTTQVSVTLGSRRFPEFPIKTSFTAGSEIYTRAFNDLVSVSRPFTDATSSSHVNYKNFGTLYPIWGIELDSQDEALLSGGSAELVVELERGVNTASHLWAVVVSERQAKMSIIDKKMTIVKA